MSIRLKLLITYLSVALIPAVFVGILTFHNYSESFEKSRISDMKDLAALKAEKIETYFAGLKANMETARAFYNIKKNLPILVRLGHSPSVPEFLDAKKTLDDQLRPMQSVMGLADIMLVGPSGKTVYSTDPAHSRKEFLRPLPDPRQKAFAKGRNGVYVSDVFLNNAEAGGTRMLITGPAYDLNNVFSGIIVFEINTDPVYKLVQDETGLGATGEILLSKKVGDKLIYLNPLRYDPGAAFKKTIVFGSAEAIPSQKAVQGKNGAGLSIDYRGRKVIAGWRYLPSLDWGIVAKIDTEEAFAPIESLRRLLLIILIVIVAVCGVTAISLARSISDPIKTLTEGAAIIGGGNLDYKVGTGHKDEIGRLSRAFDAMTSDLKKTTASRDALNAEILERKKIEAALRKSEAGLNKAQEIAHLGSWELDLADNRLSWSDEVYRIFGLKPQEFAATYEAFLEAIHPDDRAAVDAAYSGSLRKGSDSYEIEHRVLRKATGEVRVVHERCAHIRNADGAVIRSIGMVHDITARKKMEEELKRSNESLEQFAYVAAHDLQEPLRMMASYSELLDRRYKPKLDSDAGEFIDYIVDGAKRLQKLINDLLAYSRIGRTDKAVREFDCNAVLGRVLGGMKAAAEETGAVVTSDPLPALAGNESNFVQLFQNLIGNAIKFRGAEPPRIHIGAEKRDGNWLFSVKDNGIGIEPQYKDRIFVIFQRLHGRDQYPGTGIGLAICKKIVETHGGRIWMESEPGKGASFHFTTPAIKEELKNG